MTLRARLIAVLVILAATGMVLLGGVTYATQRSYENARIDEQTLTAEPALQQQIDTKLGITRVRPPSSSGPRPEDANLPTGTFGQRRSAAGAVLAAASISYGDAALPAPKLPARLTDGELLTVPAVSGGTRYRVRVHREADGDLMVVAVPLAGVDAALHRLLLVEGAVIVAILLGLAATGTVLVRFELRPLRRIGATADAIAAGDLSRRVEEADERTEVGRLAAALNGMLTRLEAAFAEREASEARLRQFLSDAAHELRTPLASIRGYAELFRMGVVHEEEDVRRSIRRIEDEGARMGALVDDLLTLARLDEVRDTRREPVSVERLIEDAAADTRALAPDRDVTCTSQEATVLGDVHQLRQVLANLVANAVTHTPAGTPIELSSDVCGDTVELRVRDHGAGLPTDRPGELFGRFWRSESSRGRKRGKAGSGLGLAIVAGIVDAHSGTVAALDAPDGGAVFVVRLPLAQSASPGLVVEGDEDVTRAPAGCRA